jgi:formylglycine-generating enzyme required for sulfatase activity
MHGNVAEWTRSDYAPALTGPGSVPPPLKAVRGGSWRDRPQYCRSASRWGYPPWRKVFNVGFRVVIEPGPAMASH